MCGWSVAATRFVAELRPSKDLTVDQVDQLVASVDDYLSDHPPLSSQLISAALDACAALNNAHLMQRCTTAVDQCRQALQLLHTRRVRLSVTVDKVELIQLTYRQP